MEFFKYVVYGLLACPVVAIVGSLGYFIVVTGLSKD